MTDGDRERVRARRAHLLARLQRQRESGRFRALAPALCEHGVRRFRRLPPGASRALLAPFAGWPGRDERFDWPEIAGHARAAWVTAQDGEAIVRRALRACFAPADRLAVIFHPAESSLVIGCDDAARNADVLLRDGHGTLWIVAMRPAATLVEVSLADQDACWIVDAAIAPR